MSRCVICEKALTDNNETQICSKCINDDEVTISFSNVRRLYILTESDIENGQLFTIYIKKLNNIS